MKTIKENAINEIIVNKSRFIAHLYKISSYEQANDYISIIKKKYYDASHNPYAFITKLTSRSNDDGEPSKTAGSPILSVLNKMGLSDILCIVTRYFGGVKLGSGGLIRAYKNATKDVLNIASFIITKKLDKYKFAAAYNYKAQLDNYITKYCFLIKIVYSDQIEYEVATDNKKIIVDIMNITNGKIKIEPTGSTIIEIDE